MINRENKKETKIFNKSFAEIKETVIKGCFLAAAVFAILAVISIFVFLFLRGAPAIAKAGVFKFLFGTYWGPKTTDTFDKPLTGFYGILPMIVGSVYATAGALLVGGVLGFFAAVYLAMFCPKKIKSVLTQTINLLAGIPSIVYGFFGVMVLLPQLGKLSANGSGKGLLAVSIILGIMILPTVTALSKAGIEAVDNSYLEGAVALGATREQAVFKVVVPAAKSSIFASLILGIGRAVGETMAVVMIAGNSPVFPKSLLGSFRTMTANIVFEMSYAGEFQMGALIGTGCVLFVFILLINIAFSLVTANRKVKSGAKSRIKKLKITEGVSTAETLADAERKKAAVKWQRLNKGIKYFSYFATYLAVAAFVFIIAFVLINGLPHITGQLLFGEFTFSGPPTILPSIIATLMMVLLTSLIAFPLGIFTAIYLTEYTKKNSRLVKIIRMSVEILGGIPSIVYGLFGMIFFCGILGFGTSIAAGCLTVSLMIIPTTVRATEEALKAVPDSYREGSFALGSGKFRTIYKVVLPSALPGILAAVILGIGKMLSESAPFLFTMGAGLKDYPQGYSSAGSTLAVSLYALAREGLHVNEAYATACILILVVLALNLLSTFLVSRLQRKLLGKTKTTKTNRKKTYA